MFLLNYGYAALLSTILQKLFAVGLDPTFGISHVVRAIVGNARFTIVESTPTSIKLHCTTDSGFFVFV